MTIRLIKYEAARAAVQAAHDLDEAKEIRDKAQALAAYARQARDTQMLQWVTEIKVRAERRCGEMLAASKVNGDRDPGGRGRRIESHDATQLPTLTDIGITRDQSSRFQRLAAMPEEHFETAVETAKATAGEVTSAHMLRLAAQLKESADLDRQLARIDAKAAKRARQDPVEIESRYWYGIEYAVTTLAARIAEQGATSVPRCAPDRAERIAHAIRQICRFMSLHLGAFNEHDRN